MDNTYVQAAMWIFAGLLMIVFLARRRKRRTVR